MPIPTNYDELKAEIANWLNRDDLTTNIPTFIEFAENKINRLLEISRQEVETTVTMTTGQLQTALPSGFDSNISLIYEGDTYTNPVQVSINDLDKYKDSVNSGIPYYFAISGGNYNWSIKPSKDYVLKARYVKKLDIATDSTNWLLSTYPDLYLYMSLVEAGVFIEHPQVSTWEVRANEALRQIEHDNTRKTKSNLGVDNGLRRHERFNIYTNY